MAKHGLSIGSLIIAVALFFAVNIFSSAALTKWRLDLTDNDLYTLTDGTRDILADLEEPVTLRLFLSRQLITQIPVLSSYARRVEDLLREYERQSGGVLDLRVIDPEPFSEEEDLAQRHGLRSVPLDEGGDSLYFGLVANNSVDDTEVIQFFSPQRERLLEYDLSRLVHQLSQSEPPVVGLLSSLPLKASPRMGAAPQRSWLIVEQIEKLFQLENIDPASGEVPDNVDVLMVAHPKGLSERMLYAIDQFVLSGGRALVFVDSYMEMESRGQGAAPSRSDLGPLLGKWGLSLAAGQVAADMRFAERVRYNRDQRQVLGEFPVWINIPASHLNDDDVVTANVGNVLLATPGFLEKSDDASTSITPLMQSSSQADRFEVSVISEAATPAEIIEAYQAGDEVLTLAARITGPAQTAFPDGAPPPSSEAAAGEDNAGDGAPQGQATMRAPVRSADNVDVIVVADVDMLHEQFWAQRQNLFGSQVVVPSASNADLVINALENLTGSSDLISVRSRGEFSRPFTKVTEIRQDAELKYRQKEQELLDRLEETEQALLELEQGKRGGDQSRLMLTEEQRREIERFRQEKVRIRKELRQVQHQLRKDIDTLEGWLKFINIGFLPLVIVVGATLVSVKRSRRRR